MAVTEGQAEQEQPKRLSKGAALIIGLIALITVAGYLRVGLAQLGISSSIGFRPAPAASAPVGSSLPAR